MGLDVLVGELGDILQDGKDRIAKLKRLGQAERVRNAELFMLLDRMEAELEEFRKRLLAAHGTGLAGYDAVKFLNNMLKLGYQGILDYNLYAGSLSDPDIRGKFLKFGAVEIEHAKLMFSLIRRYGGTPRPGPPSVRRRRKITLRELVEERLAAEAEAVSLCEKGINTFTQPELQWALGTIRLDEIEHVRELRKIYEKRKLAAEPLEVGKKYVPPKEIDFDDDEPWTE